MKENIEKEIKEWNAKIRFPEGSKEKLKSKIISGIAQNPRTFSLIVPEGYFLLSKALVFRVAAAVIIIVALIPTLSHFSGHDKETLASTTAPLTQEKELIPSVSRAEITEMKELYRRIFETFDNRVKWVARRDGRTEIAVRDVSEPANGKKIVVRQTVLRMKDGRTETVLIADIVATPGEQVAFSGPEGESYFWIYDTGDGVFAIEGSSTLSLGGDKISMNYSCGQLADSTSVLKRIIAEDSEYMITQTITRI